MKYVAMLLLSLTACLAQAAVVDTSSASLVMTSTTKDFHTPDGWVFSSYRNMPAYQLPEGLYVGNRSGISRPGGWLMIFREDGGQFDLNSLAVYDHYQYACGQNYCGLDSMQMSADNGDSYSWRMDGNPGTLDSMAFPGIFNGITKLSLGLTGEGWLLSAADLSLVQVPLAPGVINFAVGALLLFGLAMTANKPEKQRL